MIKRHFDVEIDYDRGRATIPTGGVLELCMIWLESARRIREQTGLEPREFLSGMEDLLVPAVPEECDECHVVYPRGASTLEGDWHESHCSLHTSAVA